MALLQSNATMGFNLQGVVDKYGFGNYSKCTMQYEDMDGKQQQTLKGFDAKIPSRNSKIKS